MDQAKDLWEGSNFSGRRAFPNDNHSADAKRRAFARQKIIAWTAYVFIVTIMEWKMGESNFLGKLLRWIIKENEPQGLSPIGISTRPPAEMPLNIFSASSLLSVMTAILLLFGFHLPRP